jgi:predicted Zn-dependent peptidase
MQCNAMQRNATQRNATQDTGLFGVYMVAPENKLEDLAWYTLHALLKCVHQTTEEEVAYAKAQLKTNYLQSLSTLAGANDVRALPCPGPFLCCICDLGRQRRPTTAAPPSLSPSLSLSLSLSHTHTLQSPNNQQQNLGRQMLTYGRVMTPAEFFARVDAVSVADVKAVADQVINDQDHALAAVG